MRLVRFVAVFALIGLVSLATQATDDKQPKPKPNPKQKQTQGKPAAKSPEAKSEDEDVLTFTTEDLARKYGPSVAPTPKEATPTAVGNAQDKAAMGNSKLEKATSRAATLKAVQQAEASIQELEKNLARLRNPLLGRAQPHSDDAESWAAADQVGRIRLTEERLESARAALAEARKKQQDEN